MKGQATMKNKLYVAGLLFITLPLCASQQPIRAASGSNPIGAEHLFPGETGLGRSPSEREELKRSDPIVIRATQQKLLSSSSSGSPDGYSHMLPFYGDIGKGGQVGGICFRDI